MVILMNQPKRYYSEGRLKMSRIVILSGSPSATSRTDIVLLYVKSLLEKEGFIVTYISVQDIPPEDLVYARFSSDAIKNISSIIEKADGVIIGSPVYKASYTGVLKALLDLLPEQALKNKPVFPFMIGGSKAHLLAIEFALKPIIHNLKGKATQGLYLVDSQIDKENRANPFTEEDDLLRLRCQLEDFLEAIHLKKQLTVSLV